MKIINVLLILGLTGCGVAVTKGRTSSPGKGLVVATLADGQPDALVVKVRVDSFNGYEDPFHPEARSFSQPGADDEVLVDRYIQGRALAPQSLRARQSSICRETRCFGLFFDDRRLAEEISTNIISYWYVSDVSCTRYSARKVTASFGFRYYVFRPETSTCAEMLKG